MSRRIKHLVAAVGALAIILFLIGCKERISPHVAPEGDPEVLVAGIAASQPAEHGKAVVSQAPTARITLTLNNAPAPNELFELEITQRLVELFEQKNPDIQIEFSTWRFTPESFYERARSRTLTDVVEVSVDQMSTIIDLSLAADMTSYLAKTPEVDSLNPAALELTSRGGRIFGVPVELHSMALFYNRQIFEDTLHPKAKSEKGKSSSQPKAAEKKPSKGGNENGSVFEQEQEETGEAAGQKPLVIAQVGRFGQSSDRMQAETDNESQEERTYTRRGEQQIENDYQVTPRPRFSWPFRAFAPTRVTPRPAPRPSLWRRSSVPQEETQQTEETQQQGQEENSDIESARPSFVSPGRTSPTSGEEEVLESARPQLKRTPATTETVSTTTVEEAVAVVIKEEGTTAIKNADLPRNWEDFIRLAVKLTNHESGQYGYAPVLFAQEGGREFIQWAVLAGLSPEKISRREGIHGLRSQSSADALQFLRELRWRYDVMPSAEKCYADNVMKMFADGKIAMIMLPATKESVRRLMRLGMSPDNMGVAPLPEGPASRRHLVMGKCLIVNSQIDPAKRDAAARWIRFLLDPDVLRLREQYLFREQDLTGIPRVPLYKKEKQAQVYTMLKPYRMLPVFLDYEDVVTTGLCPEPSYLRDRLYEEVAKEIRPAVESKDIPIPNIVQTLAVDFERKYLLQVSERPTLDTYLKIFALPKK